MEEELQIEKENFLKNKKKVRLDQNSLVELKFPKKLLLEY
jgi:hypothetical protein